jgi:hypothetical protein
MRKNRKIIKYCNYVYPGFMFYCVARFLLSDNIIAEFAHYFFGVTQEMANFRALKIRSDGNKKE